MSSVFNKNCCQKKIKNPKYVGYRIYKRVFNYSVWVQVWCTEKKSQKIWQTSRADSRQNLMFFCFGAAAAVTLYKRFRCEYSHEFAAAATLYLRWRAAYAPLTLAVWNGR